MNDELGDIQKSYENIECGRRFLPLIPIIARIDGRAFHTFTKGMIRPFDTTLQWLMSETLLHLMQETNANLGYTQSDEISLTWHSPDIKSQIWFDGRIAKMTSQLAAQATLKFNQLLGCQELADSWLLDSSYIKYRDRFPTFDARVWQVPNRNEAANYFLWREQDCTKNSISMAAGSVYSHTELEGKNGSEKQEMLFQKGINWNDYPVVCKRGQYIQRRKIFRKFTTNEIDKLPPKHEARKNPNLEVERSQFKKIDMPKFSTLANPDSVIFGGQIPIILQKSPDWM